MKESRPPEPNVLANLERELVYNFLTDALQRCGTVGLPIAFQEYGQASASAIRGTYQL